MGIEPQLQLQVVGVPHGNPYPVYATTPSSLTEIGPNSSSSVGNNSALIVLPSYARKAAVMGGFSLDEDTSLSRLLASRPSARVAR